jgi:hypothetical protein
MQKRVLIVVMVLAVTAIGLGVWAYSRRKDVIALGLPTAAEFARAFPKGGQTVLEKAPQLILYSLDPSSLLTRSSTPEEGNGRFHDYPILGQVTISDPVLKQQLLAHLYDGFAFDHYFRKTGLSTVASGCFNPRHAIRAVSDGKTFDLILCFSCGNTKWFFEGDERWGGITHRPQAFFNKILTENRIPIAP